MLLSRISTVAAAGLACLTGPVQAGCAGLSAGAIASKFSEAMQSCDRVAPAATSVSANGSPIVVVPTSLDLPTSIGVPYSATHSPRRRARDRDSSTLLAVSQRFRIDPLLLHSIVAKESAGRLDAVSNKGALGLMQIMPGTARGLGVRDPSRLLVDPELNLITGATYLKQLQGQFGNNVPAVLAAYNAGPGAVRRYRGTPPYAETRDYVRTIMKKYRGARGESRAGR